ncbi:MAG: hypothetical protein J0H74_15580 [Chitinophagaceae bacterium]|nr:hypothetical protein [Chitinophagaceae bacterium]
MLLTRKSCWAALLLLIGCQSYDRSANLTLTNRTNKPVYYWVTCDSSYQDLEMKSEYLLKPNQTVKPYLLYGPEGNGPEKNSWINAINRADDSALHVFYYYIDFKKNRDHRDSVYPLIIRRFDYKVDTLSKMNWRLEYQ